MWPIYTVEYYSVIKEKNCAAYWKINGTGDHHVE
jgi:hypothetical protein